MKTFESTTDLALELGRALGWQEVSAGGTLGGYNLPAKFLSGIPPGKTEREMTPSWIHSGGCSFALVSEYSLVVDCSHPEFASATCHGCSSGAVRFDEHTDKETATRVAIAIAVLKFLRTSPA